MEKIINNIQKNILNETTDISFRMGQRPFFENICDAILKGMRTMFITGPTGIGKSFLQSKVASSFIQNSVNIKVLILVPKVTLLNQMRKEFFKFAPNLSIGFVGNSKKELGRQVTIMTYQSFLQFSNERLLDYDIIFLDEAHKAFGIQTKKKIDKQEHAVIIGFTATSVYSEKKSLKKWLKNEVHSISVREAIHLGMLSSIQFCIEDVNIKVEGRENFGSNKEYESHLSKEIIRQGGNKAAAQSYKRNFFLRRIRFIMFTVSVEQGQNLVTELNLLGVSAEIIHGKMKLSAREDLFERFRNNEFMVLVGIDVIKEGFDDPGVCGVYFAYPIGTIVGLTQGAGRSTRIDISNPNKTAYVVQLSFDGVKQVWYSDVLNGAVYASTPLNEFRYVLNSNGVFYSEDLLENIILFQNFDFGEFNNANDFVSKVLDIETIHQITEQEIRAIIVKLKLPSRFKKKSIKLKTMSSHWEDNLSVTTKHRKVLEIVNSSKSNTDLVSGIFSQVKQDEKNTFLKKLLSQKAIVDHDSLMSTNMYTIKDMVFFIDTVSINIRRLLSWFLDISITNVRREELANVAHILNWENTNIDHFSMLGKFSSEKVPVLIQEFSNHDIFSYYDLHRKKIQDLKELCFFDHKINFFELLGWVLNRKPTKTIYKDDIKNLSLKIGWKKGILDSRVLSNCRKELSELEISNIEELLAPDLLKFNFFYFKNIQTMLKEVFCCDSYLFLKHDLYALADALGWYELSENEINLYSNEGSPVIWRIKDGYISTCVLPRIKQKNTLLEYKKVLTSVGIESKKQLFALGSEKIREKSFGEYGKGTAFFGKILGRSIRVNKETIEEVSKILYLPEKL